MNNTIDYSKHSQVIEYPYTISNSILRANGNGSFDLKEMSHGGFRFYCQAMFLCFLVGIVLGILKHGYDINDKKFALKYLGYGEEHIQKRYDDYRSSHSRVEKDSVFYSPLESYEEFREGWLDKHGGFWNKFSVFFNRFVFELLLLSLILALLLVPKPIPFRVDRTNNMLYTWRCGQLYAANLHLLFARTPARANLYSILQTFVDGPYELELKTAFGDEKTFKIGCYPAQRNIQNECIKAMIDAYAKGDFDFPEDFKPTQHYLEKFSLFQKDFPDDVILNNAIEEWEKRQGKSKQLES